MSVVYSKCYFPFLLIFRSNIEFICRILVIRFSSRHFYESEKAYWPTIILLGFCIVNTVARTTSWQLIAVYAVILLAVILARKEFYREKFVYSWGALTVDSILFGCLFIGYAVAGYYAARPAGGNQVINHFLLFPSDDVWFNGLIGLSISLIGLFFLYQYLAETTVTLGEGFEKARLTRFWKNLVATKAVNFCI